MTGEGTLTERITAEIGEGGPVRFDRYVELALYDADDGFFTTTGGAGRAGADFVTSPEVGPLFGAVLARALDHWWTELDRPDPFTVVEAGAGRGALARSVLAAQPGCRTALRYVAVERSDRLRAELETVAGVEARPDLPAESFVGVLLANELLDNLPFRLVERQAGGWSEIGVGVGVGVGGDGRLAEVLLPLDQREIERIEALAPGVPAGARLPLQDGATAWLRRALDLVQRGRVVVVDYADETTNLARRPMDEWVRTYRAHGRGLGLLEAVGDQDITVEVAVDQLGRVESPTTDRTQAEFLRAHGVDELVEEGRRIWQERAHLGDLEAMKARSRLTEAEALTDPVGLGRFRVLEWATADHRRDMP